MISVHLSGLSFYAFHGVHEDERKLGTCFEVNATVVYEPESNTVSELKDLVDYEVVFGIIKQRMQIPSPLLEQVAETIISSIKDRYQQVNKISVTIFKLQPPIENFQGKAGVSITKDFA